MEIGINATVPKKSIKERLLNWLRLTDRTLIKVYHGYGHPEQLIVYGHVLKFGPLPRNHFSQNIVTNALALLRLFMVKPYPNAKLEMEWEGTLHKTETDENGFFRFVWKDEEHLPHGWHEVVVKMINNNNGKIEAQPIKQSLFY